MPKKKEEKKKEEMVSIYDPSRDAYFEAPISVAKKFVKSAKEVEKKLAEIEKK